MQHQPRTRLSKGLLRSNIAEPVCLVLAAALFLASCTPNANGRPDASETVTVALFPNMTHAPAILCVAGGYFDEHLRSGGPARRLEVKLFASGPQAVEAIFSGSIDFAYIGPGPALNGYFRSGGEALRIVAGSTSGGASLVVQPEISSTADLYGRVLATPQLGNTQDVALRAWLASKGLRTTPEGKGDVVIAPRPNSQILDDFRRGEIAGAWVPEPWASRMIVEAGGQVMVDESDLWPGGLFSTTVVVATPRFIESDRPTLEKLLSAHAECVERLSSNDPATKQNARDVVASWLTSTAGKGLSQQVLDRAWSQLVFTTDTLSETIVERAEQASAMGLLPSFDPEKVTGLFYDLPDGMRLTNQDIANSVEGAT